MLGRYGQLAKIQGRARVERGYWCWGNNRGSGETIKVSGKWEGKGVGTPLTCFYSTFRDRGLGIPIGSFLSLSLKVQKIHFLKDVTIHNLPTVGRRAATTQHLGPINPSALRWDPSADVPSRRARSPVISEQMRAVCQRTDTEEGGQLPPQHHRPLATRVTATRKCQIFSP